MKLFIIFVLISLSLFANCELSWVNNGNYNSIHTTAVYPKQKTIYFSIEKYKEDVFFFTPYETGYEYMANINSIMNLDKEICKEELKNKMISSRVFDNNLGEGKFITNDNIFKNGEININEVKSFSDLSKNKEEWYSDYLYQFYRMDFKSCFDENAYYNDFVMIEEDNKKGFYLSAASSVRKELEGEEKMKIHNQLSKHQYVKNGFLFHEVKIPMDLDSVDIATFSNEKFNIVIVEINSNKKIGEILKLKECEDKNVCEKLNETVDLPIYYVIQNGVLKLFSSPSIDECSGYASTYVKDSKIIQKLIMDIYILAEGVSTISKVNFFDFNNDKMVDHFSISFSSRRYSTQQLYRLHKSGITSEGKFCPFATTGVCLPETPGC